MGLLPPKHINSLSRIIMLCLVMISSNQLTFSAEKATPAEAKPTLGAIADAYAANRESFDTFQCRFAWRSGTVEVDQAAFSGDLKELVDYQGLWLVNKDRVRYELRCNPAILQPGLEKAAKEVAASKKKRGEVTIPCSDDFFLSNRQMSARQSKIIACVTLTPPGNKGAFGIHITPFSLGLMSHNENSDPAYFLRAVLAERFQGSLVGTVEESGRKLLHVSVGSAVNPSQAHYLFDPKQGHLPVHFWGIDSKTGKKQYDAFLLDVKDCGEGRWFPMRGVVFSGDAKTPGKKYVRELRVLDLNFAAPDPKEFYLDVPKDTQVNVYNAKPYFNVTEDERLHVDQLDEWYQRAVDHLEELKSK